MTADDVVYLVEAMVPAGSCDRVLLLAELRRRLGGWARTNPEAWAVVSRLSRADAVEVVARIQEASEMWLGEELRRATQPRRTAA